MKFSLAGQLHARNRWLFWADKSDIDIAGINSSLPINIGYLSVGEWRLIKQTVSIRKSRVGSDCLICAYRSFVVFFTVFNALTENRLEARKEAFFLT